ncbi:MAG TPA: hypothetical protein PKA88_24910 [Polyangiaceae bacterium]|nr:hypothetical protein [Polyangiaceae bacterium]
MASLIACVFPGGGSQPITTLIYVEGNRLIGGGAYIVYCVKSMHVTNNVFGNYVYGPATGNCGIWSGNVWEKDGKPVIH